MKIMVPIKRVIDAYAKIRVKADHTGVETDNVKMAMNPFDEIAIEEAVSLREKGVEAEIIVVTIGTAIHQDILRTGLALGADRAILIETELNLEPIHIASALKEIALQESPDLIIMGKQSIDGDNNQTGQMLAALLGWPQGTFISNLKYQDGTVEVVREVDAGLETLLLKLPAVLTTDLRLNVPRYPSLPNIMKAKQKPLNQIPLNRLNVNVAPHVSILKIEPPKTRTGGEMVSSIEELIAKLQAEKVI